MIQLTQFHNPLNIEFYHAPPLKVYCPSHIRSILCDMKDLIKKKGPPQLYAEVLNYIDEEKFIQEKLGRVREDKEEVMDLITQKFLDTQEYSSSQKNTSFIKLSTFDLIVKTLLLLVDKIFSDYEFELERGKEIERKKDSKHQDLMDRQLEEFK
mmetsp:Transcript_22971/g.22311  ORF Transcript_22971/g.22311 Transcript_22971/m.22311 type:complete len:154 (+) Transcript_22971:364-825(+)